MQKITPFLWFDSNAEGAVNFYTSIFENSKINKTTYYDETVAETTGRKAGSVMTIGFELNGQKFAAINGGPHFKINPSISFFVNCKTEDEVDKIWNKFSDGGSALMPLDKYPFSKKYGWIQDKFGVSWQIILSEGEFEQKFVPSLMFVGDVNGRAEEAIHFYTSVFSNSKEKSFFRYDSEIAPGREGEIAYADFVLENQLFAAMDGGPEHEFNFNEAVSFVINCKSQEEVDYFWEKLTEGGNESMCGWLKDKFGVSWQVIPTQLFDFLDDEDKEKSQRAMKAMLRMKKIEIAKLKK